MTPINNNQMSELRKKVAQILINLIGGWKTRRSPIWSEHNTALFESELDKLTTLISHEREETEKAYGGCKNCYGKGYSTYRHATTASGDFVGEKDSTTPFKVHMNFCTCERGKQLEELLSHERAEAVKGFRKELQDNFTGKLEGTLKVNVGGVVATIKAPKEGFGVVFDNKIDYAVEEYLKEEGKLMLGGGNAEH